MSFSVIVGIEDLSQTRIFLVQTRFCREWNLEFGSNTTEKFEISRGEAEWDFKFFCGV